MKEKVFIKGLTSLAWQCFVVAFKRFQSLPLLNEILVTCLELI